ncbi:hypothetical protein F5Y15DRAFT_383481 [Xylariaceae sp. FL0016]|nr:hypothetical protein F5Y15DRAFT_383481 [Xylariaceae sp. FL0016]
MRRLGLFLFALLSFIASVKPICYYPDGSVSPQDTPCDDESAESTCCGQGYACLSNNICQATGEEIQKNGASEFVRGSCTDPDWRSGSCPSFCVNSDEPDFDLTSGGMGMSKCSNTTEDIYYCINQNTDNVDCDQKINVVTFQGTPTALTTIGAQETTTSLSKTSGSHSPTASSATSPSTTSPLNTSTPQATETNDKNSGLTSSTAIIAGVIGGLAVVSFLALGFCVLRRRRRNRGLLTTPSAPENQMNYEYKPSKVNPHQIELSAVSELGGDVVGNSYSYARVHEATGSKPMRPGPFELSG